MLAKISHAKDAGAVCLRIEVAQSLLLRIGQAVQGNIRTVGTVPLRIGEDIDICFFSVAYRFGILVHLYIFIRHVLEVQHPGIENIFFAFRNEQVTLNHKFRIKAGINFGMIHGFPTGFINSIHSDLVQLFAIYARFSRDSAGNSVAAGDSAIIEKKNFGIFFKAKFFTPVYRHIGNDRSRRVFSQFIGFF